MTNMITFGEKLKQNLTPMINLKLFWINIIMVLIKKKTSIKDKNQFLLNNRPHRVGTIKSRLDK